MAYTSQVQPPGMLQTMCTPQQSPSGPFSNRLSPHVWMNSTPTSEVPFVSSSEETPLSHASALRYASTVSPESQYSHLNIGRIPAGHDGGTVNPNVVHALSLSLSAPMQVPYYENIQSETLTSIPELAYATGEKRGERLPKMGHTMSLKGPLDGVMGTMLHSQISDSRRYTHPYVQVQQESPSVGAFFAQCKYLRAVQHLLNELVSVEDAVQDKSYSKPLRTASWTTVNSAGGRDSSGSMKSMGIIEASIDGKERVTCDASIEKSASCPDLPITSSTVELTPQARQELQLKKAKLMTMLEEVDQRYRLYRSQMQGVVTMFESAGGTGAASCYTALALQAISRHFRCLRDAIVGQVKVANKGLGEEFTQLRTLQHLQMMNQHAWRPQRGLPERAVSVLRAWLFEHFLHPYPKDTDKDLLAKRTGLTRNQVSNWFINARVRLWKPMVEEMYQEEAQNDETSFTQVSNDNMQKQKDEPRVESIMACRGMDSDLCGTLSVDHPPAEGREREIHLKECLTEVAIGQSTVGSASASTLEPSFSLHDWHSSKKAKSLEDSFTMKTGIYPAVQSADKKQTVVATHAVNPMNLNPYNNAGDTKGGVVGSTTVSLTLGLQHRDPIESSGQQQQHYLFFQCMEDPNDEDGHDILQSGSQAIPEGLLERISTEDAAPASQNYISPLSSNSLEIMSQLQCNKQLHGHRFHTDFAS
ncbi:hypothetical protein KP509_01G090900 [Ceratopteris richardii]|nr:hypothetical protein KP509_01G090900 [Ceratopteris richardii]